MATFQPSSITVGYWSIRGLGAPLRMMVMYRGINLQANNYDVFEKPTGDGFDVSAWFSVKESLRQKNPLMNLPYVQDGEVLVTQTNACFLYLGRRLDLLGRGDNELVQCEQLLCEAMDLRNKIVEFSYGRDNSDASKWFEGILSKQGFGHVDKLNRWLASKYGESSKESVFFVGDSATAADFHIWELLDQLRLMAKYFSLPDPLSADFPYLSSFHANFGALPENQRYFSCKLSSLPCNNMMARFGATPSGEPWELGQGREKHWKDSTGQY